MVFKRVLRQISSDVQTALHQLMENQLSMQSDIEQRDNELRKKITELEAEIKALKGGTT